MKIFFCKEHHCGLMHREELIAHQLCPVKSVGIPDPSGLGVWLSAEQAEAETSGCWKLLICTKCNYCLITDTPETSSCVRCHSRNSMNLSHRKNNGVMDGFRDALSDPLVKVAIKLFWDAEEGCCFACRASFPTSHDLLFHIRASYLTIHETPQSNWVFSKLQFQRTKCTGKFVCCHCLLSGRLSTWTSSFAYRDYGQLCRVCNSGLWIKPVLMWQARTLYRTRLSFDRSEHERERCEACFKNVCVY